MAKIPFGTSLSDAKSIIERVLIKKAPGSTIAALKWGKVAIGGDYEMDCVNKY